MTGLWGKWKELIQSGLTAPGQVSKVPSKGSCKVRKGRGFETEKPFYFTQSSKAPVISARAFQLYHMECRSAHYLWTKTSEATEPSSFIHVELMLPLFIERIM